MVMELKVVIDLKRQSSLYLIAGYLLVGLLLNVALLIVFATGSWNIWHANSCYTAAEMLPARGGSELGRELNALG